MGAPRKVDGWQGLEFLRSGDWHHAELTATGGLGACSSGALILNFDKLCPFGPDQRRKNGKQGILRLGPAFSRKPSESQVVLALRLDSDCRMAINFTPTSWALPGSEDSGCSVCSGF